MSILLLYGVANRFDVQSPLSKRSCLGEPGVCWLHSSWMMLNQGWLDSSVSRYAVSDPLCR